MTEQPLLSHLSLKEMEATGEGIGQRKQWKPIFQLFLYFQTIAEAKSSIHYTNSLLVKL